MGIFEAFVLMALGLLLGISSTVSDVFIVGSAAFVSHVCLWVLIIALLAVHVESRARATWWSAPLSLGFTEGYYITTAASYEGFPRSYAVPLAAMAVIAPFLSYAMWTAKQEHNRYGRLLSVLIVAGTLVAGFVISGQIGVYECLVTCVLALVLMVIPTKKLRIRRVEHPNWKRLLPDSTLATAMALASSVVPRSSKRKRGKELQPPQPVPSAERANEAKKPKQRKRDDKMQAQQRPQLRPTKRKRTTTKDAGRGSARSRTTSETREARDYASSGSQRTRVNPYEEPRQRLRSASRSRFASGGNALGTARMARPSRRSR